MNFKKNNLLEGKSWHGVWTALITPLVINPKNSIVIDEESLKSLIEKQIASGIHGFVIAGSTGEGSLLSSELYRDLLSKVHAIVAGRVPLVAGIGIGGTDACVNNIRIAKSIGYDGVLASPPAYVKAPQRGLVEHYLALGQEEMPVCIYEVASRAASSIDVSTLAEITNSKDRGAQFIVATKDASGDMVRARQTVSVLKDRLALLTGDDFTIAPFIKEGGKGVISVVSHLTPRSLAKIVKLSIEGHQEASEKEQARLLPLIEALFWESNPIPVKSVLFDTQQIKNLEFARPLVTMNSEKLQKLTELARELSDIS